MEWTGPSPGWKTSVNGETDIGKIAGTTPVGTKRELTQNRMRVIAESKGQHQHWAPTESTCCLENLELRQLFTLAFAVMQSPQLAGWKAQWISPSESHPSSWKFRMLIHAMEGETAAMVAEGTKALRKRHHNIDSLLQDVSVAWAEESFELMVGPEVSMSLRAGLSEEAKSEPGTLKRSRCSCLMEVRNNMFESRNSSLPGWRKHPPRTGNAGDSRCVTCGMTIRATRELCSACFFQGPRWPKNQRYAQKTATYEGAEGAKNWDDWLPKSGTELYYTHCELREKHWHWHERKRRQAAGSAEIAGLIDERRVIKRSPKCHREKL